MGRAYLAVSTVTVLWAVNFTVAKIAAREFDPFLIAACRVFATAAVFYAFLPREERKIDRSDLKAFLPLSLLAIVLHQTCFVSGIKLTTPSHSAIIHVLIPVITAVAAWFLIRERISPLGMMGMALAVAGALIVVLGVPGSEFLGTIMGDLLTMIGITGFSFYTVLGRRQVARVGSFRVVTFAFLLATPFMVPVLIAGLLRQDWHVLTWRGWTALPYTVVCATMICYRLHIFALTRLTAGRVAAFTVLQPALGTGVSVLFGEDRVTPTLLVGAAVALAGVIFVQWRR
jgi:drug/metabolite transporter (DMT)-like permease